MKQSYWPEIKVVRTYWQLVKKLFTEFLMITYTFCVWWFTISKYFPSNESLWFSHQALWRIQSKLILHLRKLRGSKKRISVYWRNYFSLLPSPYPWPTYLPTDLPTCKGPFMELCVFSYIISVILYNFTHFTDKKVFELWLNFTFSTIF